ncbi:hypothetical protein M408DRAFT_330900 [Serendipita vermifera MAFF 305830]|uniref:SWR1-complex protein 4 n=1 Tax=Serendipita vermifera MAFF 305830 TaxID=933852 RepID=A0A0C2X9J4_SERVB|nr:hypothetical protein M408DRAFT_330900 [Serendipita vermifera MAFF 305830]
MWSNYRPESLDIDTLPDVSHLSLNTSPLKRPPTSDSALKPAKFGVPTLSLLPSPRRIETLDDPNASNESKHGKLKYRWQRLPFKNPVRHDTQPNIVTSEAKGKGRADDADIGGLRLRHWTRVPASTDKDEEAYTEDPEPYPFARYASSSQVYSYTDEEYATHVNDPDSGWSKEETDYLFNLLQAYNARFYIVQDRYEYPGTPEQPAQKREVEDLKARYYSVVRRLIMARTGPEPESVKMAESLVLRYGFDHAQEKARREHVANLWARTPAQVAEETHLYTELLRLSQTATEFTGQRHHLLRLLAGIESGLPDIRTRDDRLAPLNADPQIRGMKGGQWGALNSAGPGGSAARKRRGVGPAGQSIDWGESPIHGNNVISLGSASAQRQLLPPAQQAEYDARHHIIRAPPGSTLINPKNTHTPVHTRSSKFPVPKPVLASYIQGYSQASADATGTNQTSGTSLFTRIDVHTNKLAMPTKENMEWMERVFAIAGQLVEVQRAIERVDVELSTQRTRLGLPNIKEKEKEKKDEQMQGVETSAPAAASASAAESADNKPLRASSRKRTMSVSSGASSVGTNKRMKT